MPEKLVYIEVVDADTGSAYAWLAIGRFEPAVVNVPRADPSAIAQRLQAGANLPASLTLRGLESPLKAIVLDSSGRCRKLVPPRPVLSLPFGQMISCRRWFLLIGEASTSAELRDQTCSAAAERNITEAQSALIEALRVSPRRVQSKLAQTLAASADGADTLLRLVSENKVPASSSAIAVCVKSSAALKSTSINSRLEELTRELPPPNEAFDKLVSKRRRGYEGTKSSASGAASCLPSIVPCAIKSKGRGPSLGRNWTASVIVASNGWPRTSLIRIAASIRHSARHCWC